MQVFGLDVRLEDFGVGFGGKLTEVALDDAPMDMSVVDEFDVRRIRDERVGNDSAEILLGLHKLEEGAIEADLVEIMEEQWHDLKRNAGHMGFTHGHDGDGAHL